jgi:hypothetical protein
MRRAASKQGRNFQKLFELGIEHSHKHSDLAFERATTPEEEELVADTLRAWNRPWDLWEAELLKRTALQDSKRKREAGIVCANAERRRKSRALHRLYREIAQSLIAKNPALGRTQHRLAQRVSAELVKRGMYPASTRTIIRALKAKK